MTGVTDDHLQVSRHILLVEQLSADEIESGQDPVIGTSQSKLLMGGDGSVDIKCQLQKSTFKAGEILYLAVGINNHTKRKVKGAEE